MRILEVPEGTMTPVVAACALCVVCIQGQAATYYVDNAAGNDSNAGTSAAAPWKNAPGMESYAGRGVLAAGDVVLFNSNGVWRVRGTQGIYLVGGVSYDGKSWGNGQRAKLIADADLGSAVVRFRDHSSRETVFKGFEVDVNGKVANGIEFNHSFYAGPLTGAVKRVDDVEVHHVWSRQASYQYRYGIIASNHGGTNGEVANVEILNSSVHDISRDGILAYPGDENANCIVRNITIRGNRVWNTGQDPDYGAGSGLVVKGRVISAVLENNYVEATKGAGIFVNGNESNHFGFGPADIHIRNNIVNVNNANGAIRVYDGASGGDPKDLRIYGNIVYNSTANGGLVLGSDLKNSNTLRIYNNTFYNAPVMISSSSATFPVFEFRNNLVYSTSGVALVSNGKFTLHTNNAYVGSGTVVRSGASSFSASTVNDFEPTARTGDPKLVNAGALPSGFTGTFGIDLQPNTLGLAPAPTSYAVDGGTKLDPAYTGSVNTVARPSGAGFDIGAYEASQGPVQKPTPPTNLRVL